MELETKKIYCIDCLNFIQQGNKATCKHSLLIDEYESGHKRYFKVKKENNSSYLYEHGKGMEALQKDSCPKFIDMND